MHLFKINFIFGCTGSSLLCSDFSLVFGGLGLLSSCDVQASPCGGFSCCRAQALRRRLNSCGTWAYLLRGMWNLPGVCSDSCPLSQGCYLTISSSAVPFSFCLHSFPASGSFPMSQLFAPCGPSIGASASALVLPMNIQG